MFNKLRAWLAHSPEKAPNPEIPADAGVRKPQDFLGSFALTSRTEEKPNALAAQRNIPAGVYNGGLLTVLGDELSSLALQDWRWLVGIDAVALASTPCGDVFYWSESQAGVYFLEAQGGETTLVEKDVGSFFDGFLNEQDVVDNLLRATAFNALKGRLGDLQYGDCYLAVPLQMLGGSGKLSTFETGGLAVYLSITAQTIQVVADKKPE